MSGLNVNNLVDQYTDKFGVAPTGKFNRDAGWLLAKIKGAPRRNTKNATPSESESERNESEKNELVHLRRQYTEKFGKKPRGVAANNMKWLRNKLASKIVVPAAPPSERRTSSRSRTRTIKNQSSDDDEDEEEDEEEEDDEAEDDDDDDYNDEDNEDNEDKNSEEEIDQEESDQEDDETKIIRLRAEYETLYGKKPRGMSSSDMNWLRKKIQEAPAVVPTVQPKRTALKKDTKDKDTARNRTRPKRSSSKSKSNTNTNTNTNNSSSKHSTEFQIPGGDKAGPATEIILLRQEYVRKFGKKPRGRSSSDVNWLRAKLSGDVPPPLSPVNESGSMETNRVPGTFDPMSPMHQEATEWKESLHSMEEASHMGSIVDMNIPDPTEARNNNSENGNGENQVMRERTIDDPNASSVSGSSSTSSSTSSSSLSSSSATSATSATSTTSSTSTSDDLLNGSRNNNMEGSTTPNTEGRNTVNGSGIVVDWTNVDQHEDSSFLMSGIMPIPVDGNSQETNLYARLAAGASSWLLAKDTVPSNSSNNNYNNGDTDSNDNNYSTSNSQSSSLSAPNSHKATPAMSPSRRPSDPSSMTTTKVPASSSSSSSSTTLPKATNHQFGASLDSAYQDKTAYLNFNTKRTTSNGQTIQVCDLNPNGVKQQPWEQRRNVTTDNGNSKTFNSSSSSTSSKHTKNNDNSTSSDKWYELPEQELTPDVRRELEIVKMRNYLNPKRFYKANDSKTLPTRFQFGTIISGQFERNSETLTRAERKNTIAESLMHDRKTRKYTKRVFDQVQDERKLPKSNKRRKQHGRR